MQQRKHQNSTLRGIPRWTEKFTVAFLWFTVAFSSYMPSVVCIMMTLWNGNIFRVTGHLWGEFTGEFHAQRPVTLSFDVFFDLRLNKRLNKQSWGWWFETPSRPLWRHRNYKTAKACLKYIIGARGKWTQMKWDGLNTEYMNTQLSPKNTRVTAQKLTKNQL